MSVAVARTLNGTRSKVEEGSYALDQILVCSSRGWLRLVVNSLIYQSTSVYILLIWLSILYKENIVWVFDGSNQVFYILVLLL